MVQIDTQPVHANSGLVGLDIVEARTFGELEPYVDQLVDKSKQDHIVEYEWEDSVVDGRFFSPDSIEQWMEIPRTVYLIANLAVQDLAGITWFSPRRYGYEHSRTFGHTFGIRLYEGYVGQGLSQPVMTLMHDRYADIAPNEGVWLSAKQENERAIRAYTRFGYKEHKKADGLVYMVNECSLSRGDAI